MAPKGTTPLKTALDHLKAAIAGYKSRVEDDPLPFLTLTKAFEVAVEHAWRVLKDRAEDEGLEIPSPKAAIRAASKLGIINDPQLWFDAIEARNNSVHDYFGITESDFVKLAEKFVGLSEKLLNPVASSHLPA